MSDIPITISLDVMSTNFGEFDKLRASLQQTFDTLTEGARQFLALAAEGDRFGDVMSALKTDITEARDALKARQRIIPAVPLTVEQGIAVALRASGEAASGVAFRALGLEVTKGIGKVKLK